MIEQPDKEKPGYREYPNAGFEEAYKQLHEGIKANQPAPNPYEKNPAVHSPAHYTRGGIETIDFIEAKGLNFHLGNAVKYISRAGFKQDAKIQDLEKAIWYLTREINRIERAA